MDTQANFGERYFFKKNPKQGSKFPYLFFDFKANLHLPLTSFTAYLNESYALNTIRSYMYEVTSFFSWYHNEIYPENGTFWEQEPEKIHSLVSSYLFLKLKCQIRMKGSVNLVYRTKDSSKSVGVFLSALRCFYSSVIRNKLYKFENPLISISSAFYEENTQNNQSHFPVMPIISGTSEIKIKNRLTDSFFILADNKWVPQIISDDDFPNKIFYAGKLVGWSLRQILITRLLFETGARISEVCSLTLGDWNARGMKNEADSISKGSFQRRVKFIRWSNDTSKLLKIYFDYHRVLYDRNNLKISDYVSLSENDKIDLYHVPIFITNRGTPLKPNVYRDLYWNPACKKSKIQANIHQTRHWYVTKIIEEIYALDLPNEKYEKKVNELIRYMNWKSGNETLKVYEHFFDKIEHLLIQDKLHSKLDIKLKNDVSSSTALVNCENGKSLGDNYQNNDDELDFLWKLGGS